jgi:cbb3-type cytochrome oxidase subunit 3
MDEAAAVALFVVILTFGIVLIAVVCSALNRF